MNGKAAHILIVEDERQIRRFMRTALETEAYRVSESSTCREGLATAAASSPDLVLLDLSLPDGDGMEFVRDLRSWSHAPVIVVSARHEEAEKIRALDAGADDYLTKPFGVGELLARVRALLRRPRADDAEPLIRFGEVTVDLSRRLVWRHDEAVHLSPLEYRLLATLLGHPHQVLTHRFLLREVWGPGYADSSHYLRIYIGHLRQKLEANPTQPQHILTETGIGYRFEGNDQPEAS